MKLITFSSVVALLLASFSLPLQAKTQVISLYESVSKALANDSLPEAKSAASALATDATTAGETAIAQYANAVAASDSIETAREAFKSLSAETIKKVGDCGGLFVMTCPMAKADWLQTSSEVANPYMGHAMLRCGSVKKGESAGGAAAASGCPMTAPAKSGCCK